ncbi:MAG: 4-hydroxy-tetrahydrodipicolinate synthase [Alphaproteobacteria bacterium]|nr:4-hydroxy-tetrahydrodipicolinate synthase [Alphaproteobacteria bacterium]
MTQHLHGAYTALITPFKAGALDIGAYEALIEWQIAEGIHGVVPVGTTGESPTVAPEEHKKLVEVAVKTAKGRIGVMAGTGSNSTAEAIDFTKHAEKAGASSCLVVAPYYNKPIQEGIFQHYKAIASATSLPIIVYNIPGRSVINITDQTLARLAEIPNIAGVKDATGDLARPSTLRRLVGDRLVLFSGEDMTAVGFNAMGGKGVISVTSNIVPKLVAEVQNLSLAGKYKEALELHERLVFLHQAMFCETSPSPVKYAASLLGKSSTEVRLPLVEIQAASKAMIRDAMLELQLI